MLTSVEHEGDSTIEENDSTSEATDTSLILNDTRYKKRWLSIRLMYLTMFLSSLGFSICLSSIWPYFQTVDDGANENFLGLIVASFSIGQLIASPIFGILFNKWKQAKMPLIIAFCIIIIGNLIYSFVHVFPGEKRYALLSARFITGFGCGCAAVVRSYVSGATNLSERTGALANITMFQSLAFIIGPAIQAGLASLGYPGPIHDSFFHLNVYTSTGYLSVLVLIINLILILTIFEEFFIHETEKTKTSISNLASQSINDSEDVAKDEKPDLLAAFLQILLFFILLFNFSVFETVLTPLTQAMYGWSKIDATLYGGILLAGCGFVSIVTFVIIKPLTKIMSEIDIMLGSFVLVFIAFLLLTPWFGSTPAISFERVLNYSVNLSPIIEDAGCPAVFSWCYTVPVIQLWQLISGILIHSCGYPAASVIVFSTFSKILGPIRQGTWMGLLAVGGSLARCVGPVYVTLIYSNYGPRVTFISSSALVVVAITLTFVFNKRFVPFEFYLKQMQNKKSSYQEI